jgi:NitT/TauT family transport system permease protein/taurine transport system permease protein
MSGVFGLARSRVWRIGIALGLLALWSVVAAYDLVSPLIVPSPASTVAVVVSEPGIFLSAFRLTVVEILVAVVVAWTGGVAVGLAIGANRLLRDAFQPLFAALFSVPLVITYPLFIAYFGIGPASKIVFGALYGFFPVLLNTMAGLRNVHEQYLLAARSMGASRLQLVLLVLVPLTVPAIVSGLRIGAALVVIGILVTEMLASTGGLGFLIAYNQTLYRPEYIYVAILASLLIVYLLNRALSALESRTRAWREDESDPGTAL